MSDTVVWPLASPPPTPATGWSPLQEDCPSPGLESPGGRGILLCYHFLASPPPPFDPWPRPSTPTHAEVRRLEKRTADSVAAAAGTRARHAELAAQAAVAEEDTARLTQQLERERAALQREEHRVAALRRAGYFWGGAVGGGVWGASPPFSRLWPE